MVVPGACDSAQQCKPLCFGRADVRNDNTRQDRIAHSTRFVHSTSFFETNHPNNQRGPTNNGTCPHLVEKLDGGLVSVRRSDRAERRLVRRRVRLQPRRLHFLQQRHGLDQNSNKEKNNDKQTMENSVGQTPLSRKTSSRTGRWKGTAVHLVSPLHDHDGAATATPPAATRRKSSVSA